MVYACDNGTTDADDKQRHRHTGTSIKDRTVCVCVCGAGVFIRRKRTLKPSNIAHRTDISLDISHSTAHVKLVYRKECACWVMKYLPNDHTTDSWRIKDQLDVTCYLIPFLCAQHVSDINISIIRSLRLFCWITTLVVLFLVRCVLEPWYGWVGVVSVLQAEAQLCIVTKNNTTNVIIQQNSRKLMVMDILMSETCWAHKKWNKIASDIKLVFYSSTITMMHGPINIRSHNSSCGLDCHVNVRWRRRLWRFDVQHLLLRAMCCSMTEWSFWYESVFGFISYTFFFIFEYFSKIFRENSSFIKIWQE